MYTMKTLKNLLLAGFIGIGGMLAGCGGGGAATSTPGVSGGADDPTAAAVPTLSITLENAADNAALTTLSSGITGKLTATVKNAKGEVVPNALVTFATNSAVATFNQIGRAHV